MAVIFLTENEQIGISTIAGNRGACNRLAKSDTWGCRIGNKIRGPVFHPAGTPVCLVPATCHGTFQSHQNSRIASTKSPERKAILQDLKAKFLWSLKSPLWGSYFPAHPIMLVFLSLPFVLFSSHSSLSPTSSTPMTQWTWYRSGL